MNDFSIVDREMTASELARMNTGFDEDAIEENVDIQKTERFGFVILDGKKFVGCASGLAYKNGENFSGWFFLTDLFVEKEHRSKGLGSKLLKSLEEKVAIVGVKHIWLWTSGEGALKFYRRLAYHKFAEKENWYSDGSSRVGLRKKL